MWKHQATALFFLAALLACAPMLSSQVRADEFRLVIERSERVLHVHNEIESKKSYQVAVGQPDHETPLGSWNIRQVDVNPDWMPPDAEWAADQSYKEPGEEGNPMGRIRLNFDPPYTIHGTDERESLGKAASHGSVRMANDEIVELARKVLKAGNAWKGEEWYEGLLADPSEMHEIVLEKPVPIEIKD